MTEYDVLGIAYTSRKYASIEQRCRCTVIVVQQQVQVVGGRSIKIVPITKMLDIGVNEADSLRRLLKLLNHILQRRWQQHIVCVHGQHVVLGDLGKRSVARD